MQKFAIAIFLIALVLSLPQLSAATTQPQMSFPTGEETPVELEAVVITATRTEQKVGQSTANVTVLKKDEIANSPAYVVDDLLRQIPGFNTFRRSSSLVTAPQQDPEAQG